MPIFRFDYDGRFEEKDGEQFLSGRGVFGDGYTNIRRIEPHGFYSNPPPQSKGLVLGLGRGMDEAYLIGVDHPGKRPSGLPAGASALYDADGNIIKLIGDGVVMDFQSNTATFTAGPWTINVPTMTINGNVQINGNVTCSGTIIDGDGNNGA